MHRFFPGRTWKIRSLWQGRNGLKEAKLSRNRGDMLRFSTIKGTLTYVLSHVNADAAGD